MGVVRTKRELARLLGRAARRLRMGGTIGPDCRRIISGLRYGMAGVDGHNPSNADIMPARDGAMASLLCLRAGADRAAKGLAASPIGECGCQTPTVGPVGRRGRRAPSASPVGAGSCRGRAVRPSGRDTTTGKRGSGSARHVRKPAPSDVPDPGRWPREPDTFRALHGSGPLRRALRLHGWDPARAAEAAAWMAPRFRTLRSASSATCSDNPGLAALLRKHYLWGCRTYDPKKAGASARAKARAEDEARIASSLRLGDRALEAYLRVVAGLSRA